ncbi:hypothetical protein, partial [Rhizobacter sp. Root29]|uniref:hypothetical protein n=1 Tax=Rhizobacter sp. Root29 TaxID=1736511 RepID=UPI001F3C9B0D
HLGSNESDSPAGARPGSSLTQSKPADQKKTDPEGSVESTFQRQEEIKKTKVANSHYPGKNRNR